MKICLLSYHCCPFSQIGGNGVGGMNVYLKEMTSELARFHDIEIDIFTRRQDPEIQEIKRISPALRVIHLKSGPDHYLNRKELSQYVSEFVNNLERFILDEGIDYDLINSHYWLSGLAGEKLRLKFSIPLVHSYHTLGFLQNRALSGGEPEKRFETERRLAQAADVIISSSREEQEKLTAEFSISSDKVNVIDPGVNIDLFYPVSSPDVLNGFKQPGDLLLLYVGRIEPVKGLRNVVEAFDILRRTDKALFDTLKLVVIGGGRTKIDNSRNNELLSIQGSVKQMELSSKVLFLGSLKQQELKEYYSAADALIVPSVYESFGLVVLEALACGTPALVSRIGKMRELIRDGKNGFSFDPFDQAALSACIRSFSTQKDELYSENILRQDIINRFSWGKTAELTKNVFNDLVSAGLDTTTIFQPDERPQLV